MDVFQQLAEIRKAQRGQTELLERMLDRLDTLETLVAEQIEAGFESGDMLDIELSDETCDHYGLERGTHCRKGGGA